MKRMPIRQLIVFCLVAVALAATPSSRAQDPVEAKTVEAKAPELSKKLAQFVYIEEGHDIVFTVGVRAAGLREKEAFFPLEISIINKQKDATWRISRESFVLIDEAGNRYEVPGFDSFSERYRKRHIDNRYFDARAFTAEKQVGFFQVDSNFFPDASVVHGSSDTVSGTEGVARRSTSLTPWEIVELNTTWFISDVLYFPHPEGELVGERFRLEFRDAELEEPAVVAFRIPKIR